MFVWSVYEIMLQLCLAYCRKNIWDIFEFGGLFKLSFLPFALIIIICLVDTTYFYIAYLNLANIQWYVPTHWPGNTGLQALNCLITCSMGALQMGHGSSLCFKTWAQAQQLQQCPVSPWMSVAFLGLSMQIIHLVLTSVSSGDATVFPFSVMKDGLASAADAGVKRSLVIHGFSSGLRLKLKPAARIK